MGLTPHQVDPKATPQHTTAALMRANNDERQLVRVKWSLNAPADSKLSTTERLIG